jgi:hypothetical protein
VDWIYPVRDGKKLRAVVSPVLKVMVTKRAWSPGQICN